MDAYLRVGKDAALPFALAVKLARGAAADPTAHAFGSVVDDGWLVTFRAGAKGRKVCAVLVTRRGGITKAQRAD